MTEHQYEKNRAMFFRLCRGAHGAVELLDAWERLLDKPAYSTFVEHWLMLLAGHRPMPNLDQHEALIRSAGHELAAADVLRPSNLLTLLFSGRAVTREVYQGFHMFLASRLMDGPAVFGEQELSTLYSLMDRLLRGGRDWMTTDHVPAASRQFYLDLAAVTMPVLRQVTVPLNSILELRGLSVFGDRYERVKTGALSPQTMLAAAVSLKHGRNKVSIADSMEAAWIYIEWFDVDLKSLPLVSRDGRSGYESSA